MDKKFLEANKLKNNIFIQAKNIIRSGEEHLPIFFIHSSKGIAIIGMPFGNGEEKDKSALAIKILCEKANADFFVFVSEGWALKFNKDEKWDGTRPSESPDKIEVLQFFLNLRDGSTYNISYKIIRNDKIIFKKLAEGNGDGSRFACKW